MSLEVFVFNCINYTFNNGQIVPFLVYKLDDYGKLEKLTFLGVVFEVIDIITLLNTWEGYFFGHTFNDTNIYDQLINLKRRGSVPVYELKHIFDFLLQNSTDNIYVDKKCSCPLSFNHEHIKCNIHSECKIKMQVDILMINYDDLTNNLKLEYNKLFETKNCGTSFLKLNDMLVDNYKVIMRNKVPVEEDDLDDIVEYINPITKMKIQLQNDIDDADEEIPVQKNKSDIFNSNKYNKTNVVEDDELVSITETQNRIVIINNDEELTVKITYETDDEDDVPIKNIQNKTCASEYKNISEPKNMFKINQLLSKMKQN